MEQQLRDRVKGSQMETGVEGSGIEGKEAFVGGTGIEGGKVFFAGASHSVTFLPEQDRRLRRFTLISVDDHLVEPPETWAGRIPARMVEYAPRVVDLESGGQAWMYDGN